MNRLKGNRAYLAGPIDRAEDGGIEWRENITPFLQDRGIVVLNPCNKPTDLASEDPTSRQNRVKMLARGEYDEVAKEMKLIRNIDLRMVDNSDFLIVNIDLDIHATGTYEEIFWANRMKMPILIRVRQKKTNTPHWLLGVVPHQFIFDDWDGLKSYIQYIDTSKHDIETFNRWMFFKY